MEEEVVKFIEELEAVYESGNLKKQFIINIDETRSELGRQAVPNVKFVTLSGSKPVIDFGRDCMCTTTVPAVDSSGKLRAVLYIYQPVNVGDDGFNEIVIPMPESRASLRTEWKTYYATTNSGIIDGALWKQFIKAILEDMRVERGDLPTLILSDKASQHSWKDYKQDLEELGFQNVHMLQFPAGTTDFLQPLDALPFSNLKNLLRQRLASGDNSDPERQIEFGCHLDECLKEAFSKSVVEESFRMTGMFPFDKDLILDNFFTISHAKSKKSQDSEKIYQIHRAAMKIRDEREVPKKKAKRMTLVGLPRSILIPGFSVIPQPPEKRKSRKRPAPSPEPEFVPPEEEDIEEIIFDSPEPQKRRRGQISENLREVSILSQQTGSMSCAICTQKYRGRGNWRVCEGCETFILCLSCKDRENEFMEHRRGCQTLDCMEID